MDVRVVGIFKLQKGHQEIAKHDVPKNKTFISTGAYKH